MKRALILLGFSVVLFPQNLESELVADGFSKPVYAASIPGQKGYKPTKDSDIMRQYREFSWILKG